MCRWGLWRTGIALGALALVAGCDPAEPDSGSGSSSVKSPAGSSATSSPVAGPPDAGGPAATTPAAKPAGNGKVTIKTASLKGVAIPYVPVHLRLYQPCDPAGHERAEGTPEVQRFDGVTDLSGQAVFTVPVGCYGLNMDSVPGTNPVPEGMHTVFVEKDGQSVTGNLRFQDPAPDPVCAQQTINHDLKVESRLSSATATVTGCDGKWSVIAWDVQGDSQRIVKHTNSGWTTYVGFPHDVCWAKAQKDGVPDRLKEYFTSC